MYTVLVPSILAARKNGTATPAPLETTTSGRYRLTVRQARKRFRTRFVMLRVVGWKAHTTFSPARSEVLSTFRKVTQSRSCLLHHGCRRWSWARCPPEEQTRIAFIRIAGPAGGRLH